MLVEYCPITGHDTGIAKVGGDVIFSGSKLGAVTLMSISRGNTQSNEKQLSVALMRGPAPQAYRLLLNEHGLCEVACDRRQSALHPGDLTLIDTGRPHRERFGPGPGRWSIVEFSRDLLPLPGNRVHDLLGGRLCGRTGVGALLSAFITRTARDAGGYQPSDATRLSAILLDLVAGLLAGALEADHARPERAPRGTLFEETQAYILRRLGDPSLGPRTIAAAHHVSPRTLHRVFQAHGTTVAESIRGHRLDRCRRALADPMLSERPIHAIATAEGFTSAAHFSRTFRTAFGITPQDYRRRFSS